MTPPVRDNAIEVANELLNQHEERRAIRIATAQAKEWARNIDIWTDAKPNDKDQHVLPHDCGWAVRAEGAEQATQAIRV